MMRMLFAALAVMLSASAACIAAQPAELTSDDANSCLVRYIDMKGDESHKIISKKEFEDTKLRIRAEAKMFAKAQEAAAVAWEKNAGNPGQYPGRQLSLRQMVKLSESREKAKLEAQLAQDAKRVSSSQSGVKAPQPTGNAEVDEKRKKAAAEAQARRAYLAYRLSIAENLMIKELNKLVDELPAMQGVGGAETQKDVKAAASAPESAEGAKNAGKLGDGKAGAPLIDNPKSSIGGSGGVNGKGDGSLKR